MLVANFTSVQNLSKYTDNDALKEEDSVIALQKGFEFAALNKSEAPNLDQVVQLLRDQKFWIPSLVAYNGTLGFFLPNGFLETNCNFILGDQIVSQTPEKTDPKKYNVSFGTSEFTVETVILFLPSTRPTQVGIIEELVDDVGAVNQDNLSSIIALVNPEPTISLPEGVYKVAKVTKSEKSTLLTLDNGTQVRTNKTTPENLTEIKSLSGALYASVDGKIKRGISVTGRSETSEGRVIPLGDKADYVGKIYQITAATVCNGGNSDFAVAKIGEVIDGKLSNSSWCIVDGADSQLFYHNLGKGKETLLKVASVKEPTGKNAKYRKPNFVAV